uniref:BOS complex subunit TMEM147 n=1 Tax=Ciona intestinalis TaxID=7719 RepID=F6ZXN3_CIOIN|nr:transmembrane protein 147-like [Ciona intestinalis]|eukprot:XP_002131375.1 transmembrane protein 147-like [Ciona intestinalis]
MTFVHFINCVALAYSPYVVTYKTSILSEYNTLMDIGFAGMIYMVTQLIKMLALATFFPSLDYNLSSNLNIVGEVLKSAVDIGDLCGLYYIITKTVGKPELKVLVTSIGWGGAQVLFSYFLSFWVGARSVEFDWKYIQMALDSNITLIHILAMSSLVWMWSRNDINRSILPIITTLLALCVFRNPIIELLLHVYVLHGWTLLVLKALFTFSVAAVSLQFYLGFIES